jgi:hypothetical protein
MTRRILLVILLMVVAETAWALYCAVTGVNLLLFYAVLVVSSAVFWAPGLEGKGMGSPAPVSDKASQTKT